jgi:hypothetical protein
MYKDLNEETILITDRYQNTCNEFLREKCSQLNLIRTLCTNKYKQTHTHIYTRSSILL